MCDGLIESLRQRIDKTIRRSICFVAGHLWKHSDETSMHSTEPQIRAYCHYCGHDGGLI